MILIGKNNFVKPPGEKKHNIPRSARVPTEMRLIGAEGAYRQPFNVKIIC